MYYIPFNYYTISLLIGGFTALISGFVVIIHDHKRSENQAWFALTMCTAIWSFGYFSMTVSPTHQLGFLSNWILHYAAIFIPLFYFLFVLIITNTFSKNKIYFTAFTVMAFLLTTINLSPSFVLDVIPKVGFNYAPVPGNLYVLFFAYFVILVLSGILITWNTARKSSDKSTRIRLAYTIFFTISAAVGGGSVFLTTFFATIPPYLLILFSVYPAISGYAILRHQLFDVKVIATQILIFALWVFILFRTLLAESFTEQLANSILLVVTIALGLFLIKSVKREVSQREKIELLAADLEKANVRLTELDRQKSEFVSFATHQLRAPLTAMKGYASLILEGDMGQISEEAKTGVSRIFESTETLTTIVNDYLNITRIELGTMKYAFDTVDLKALVEDVVAELKPNIEKSGLVFSFSAENGDKRQSGRNGEGGGNGAIDWRVTADRDKLKQVIVNLIDNSMKYTPSGSVKVTLSLDKTSHRFVLALRDTGIGIAPEVLSRLFQKFSRAENANKTNIKGTGLGLYVAKEIVTAHHGTIRAESAGEGKGSAFIVELEPFAKG